MLRTNWHGLRGDRARLCRREQGGIAVTVTFDAGGIVALALDQCQLTGLRHRECGVVAGLYAVLAMHQVTAMLGGGHATLFCFCEPRAVAMSPAFHAIPDVAVMRGGSHCDGFRAVQGG